MECTPIKLFIVSFFYCAVYMKYFWETLARFDRLFSLCSKAQQCKGQYSIHPRHLPMLFSSSANDMILTTFERFEEGKSSYP